MRNTDITEIFCVFAASLTGWGTQKPTSVADLAYAGSVCKAQRRRRESRLSDGRSRSSCRFDQLPGDAYTRAGRVVNAAAGGSAPEPRDLEAEGRDGNEPELPEGAWRHLIPAAAAALPAIKPADLPARLRRFARFAPARRAKLAEGPLRVELVENAVFRQHVAELARKAESSLIESVVSGDVPETADAVEVAALAYLLRPPGWIELVTRAEAHEQRREAADATAERISAAEQRAAAA
ncbi:MAG: hypothetical protein ACRDXX_08685, partial [Stackebrandtia sp.]